jgi:hypothetical protein
MNWLSEFVTAAYLPPVIRRRSYYSRNRRSRKRKEKRGTASGNAAITEAVLPASS